MVQRATTYREKARVFLAQARDELAKGDLQQASEKGWGAAALMVKAIARQRERPRWSHRHLHEVINALDQETGDPEWSSLFSISGHLHSNFYENWYSAMVIDKHLRMVERFVEKAEGLLETA